MPFGCVKPSTRAVDNRNGIEAHFKTGGEAGATWIWQVGQVYLNQWQMEECSVFCNT